MGMIPLVIMEEHHEAFFLWHYFKNKGIVSDNSILLHADSHPDMNYPHLFSSIDSICSDFKEVVNFTYTELGIASFIIPAVYQGIIGEIFWIPPLLISRKKGTTTEFVRTYKAEGKVFVGGTVKPTKKTAPREVYFENHLILADDRLDSFENRPVILDIDLDYFSCEMYQIYEKKLEVTEESYNNYIADRYHFLKLCGYSIKPYTEKGKFYFVFDEGQEQIQTVRKCSETQIDERIEKFILFLKENRVNPCLITFCRSRISSYTPRDQWQYIEKTLSEKLCGIYSFTVQKADDILEENGIFFPRPAENL